MLTPKQWDLDLYPGFQFDPLFIFYEDDAKTQPFPLAGYTAQLNVGNGLLMLTPGSGLTLGATDGTVQVLATGDQTAGLPLGELAWSLSWTPPGGQPDCPAFGVITVGQPVPARS